MAKLKKFGTFAGVFTPSILTILGVIMYLRLPTIVGQAGLWATLGIVIIAHIISVTTGLSVSSIATDKRVQAGGTYYMISRSLGLPIGGTLGLALFVGLSFSVSLYIIGFSESFLGFMGWGVDKDTIRLTGTLALLAVTIITLISTSLALRMQFLIMAAIILSLVSIVFGTHDYAPTAPSMTMPAAGGVSLMVLFGIFFPAVTGFEAGVSMSGDLQDPKKSIPRGTIWAVSVGLVVYVALTFFFAYTVDATQLATDSQVLTNIAWVPELVVAGIWGATISSALGSILGAPRILQATAVDNITPRFFAKGVGTGNDPRNALLLTFFIAEAGILIGELDVIARIVSIFFITTYGFLNLSAAFERWTSADFRPEFKVPIWVSIVGALACFIVMIQLDFLAMLGAIVILGLLYLYLKRQELTLESGDTWSGIWASLVKTGLERLSSEQLHRRNWRPNVIMFSGNELERPHLIEIGQALAGRLGILTNFELIVSKEMALIPKDAAEETEVGHYFTHQFRTPDVYEGMDQVAHLYGFSGVRPNTVLMGWSKTEKHRERFARLIDSFRQANYNTVFLNYDPERGYGNHRTIDIWWRGSGRMLTFAISLIRHLTTDSLWKTAEPRLLLVLDDLAQSDRVRRTLQQLLDDYRMPMNVRLIDNSLDETPVSELIARESARTDLTLLGMAEGAQHTERSVSQVRALLNQLGTSLVIGASTHFDALDLGVNEQRAELDEEDVDLEQELRYLPALPTAQNDWLTQDVQKIDERNRQVLTTFYEQSFVPYFRENRLIVQELETVYQSVFNSLEKDWEQYDDRFRRRRALQKATNDLFFQTRALLESVREEHLETQQAALQQGIDWYLKRLPADVLRFPTQAKVTLSAEDLKFRPKDSFAVRRYKWGQRIRRLFNRRPPVRAVRYQEVASYYLRDSRYVFLDAMLGEWQEQSLRFFTELRTSVSQVDQRLAYWEKNLDSIDQQQLTRDIAERQEAQQAMGRRQQELQLLWMRRMQIEYRRNLRLMVATLESVNGLQLLNKRRSATRVYTATEKRIAEFPEQWHEQAVLQLNTVSLDVLLQTTENRVDQEVSEFADEVNQQIDKQYIAPLEALSEQLSEASGSNGKAPVYEDLDGVELQPQLSAHYEDINKLTDQMPESLDVRYGPEGEDEDTVRVPVQQLANYWMEATLYLALQNKIGEVDQQLQRSNLVVRDMVRLANLQAEEQRATPEARQARQDALKVVDEEKTKLVRLKENTEAAIRTHLQDSFDKLSTESFVTQSGDLGGITRAYQSQQVKNKVDQYQGKLRYLVRSVGKRLLYSRSQGILLAKRLTDTEENFQSPTARVLSFVEHVAPSPTVLRRLPFYYHTLFSGKSDISDDFWIPRPAEMAQAEQAIDRLRRGYAGGILLLGERNSGKTAFATRVARRFNRQQGRVFQVYPTRAGSARVSDFTRTLRQACGQEGSTPDQIIRALPARSTVVINDLELWWERSPEGMKVINEIMRLINQHSQRCLFIVNTNPTAYHLINLLNPIADYFLNVIPYRPFTTEEIERLVLLRHWSGGMTFVLNGREEGNMTEWQKVRFFNKFFDYSGGNPGVAMGAWLSSIEKVTGKKVHLRVPKPPNYDALRDLPDDWVMLIIEFLLHKRLSLPRLRRILYTDMTQVRELLQDLLRAGLLVEKGTGVYQLNVYTEVHLINVLKEQGIL